MSLFKVKCFNQGKWDGQDELAVNAVDGKAAAEKVCGVPLTEAGGIKKLRAKVRTAGKSPFIRTRFYEE